MVITVLLTLGFKQETSILCEIVRYETSTVQLIISCLQGGKLIYPPVRYKFCRAITRWPNCGLNNVHAKKDPFGYLSLGRNYVIMVLYVVVVRITWKVDSDLHLSQLTLSWAPSSTVLVVIS